MTRLEGSTFESDGVEYTIDLLPIPLFDLNMEILRNHPELVKVITQVSQEDNYSPEIFFGCVAAYCGIVLDSSISPTQTYNIGELVEQLGNALINKREVAIASVNTIPTAATLIQAAGMLAEEDAKDKIKLLS